MCVSCQFCALPSILDHIRSRQSVHTFALIWFDLIVWPFQNSFHNAMRAIERPSFLRQIHRSIHVKMRMCLCNNRRDDFKCCIENTHGHIILFRIGEWSAEVRLSAFVCVACFIISIHHMQMTGLRYAHIMHFGAMCMQMLNDDHQKARVDGSVCTTNWLLQSTKNKLKNIKCV